MLMGDVGASANASPGVPASLDSCSAVVVVVVVVTALLRLLRLFIPIHRCIVDIIVCIRTFGPVFILFISSFSLRPITFWFEGEHSA